MKFYSFVFLLFTIFLLVFVPVPDSYGQDLTTEELERLQEIRARFIEEGFLQVSELQSVQAGDSEPLIVNSVYTGNNRSVVTSNSRETTFRPNGTRMYIVGRASRNVVEYHLSTPWDVSSASYVRELDISPETGASGPENDAPHGIYIRENDGAKMWILNRTEIWEYTLSNPWDISSASQTGYRNLSNDLVRGHGVYFRPNGTRMYVDDRVHEAVLQYNLSTAWDVSTASRNYVLDISNQQEEVRGIKLNSSGSRMYLMDTGRREILEYHISNAHDISSASFIGSFSVSSQSSDPRGLSFNSDFDGFYVTESTNNRVYQYRILIADPDESSLSASRSKVIADGSNTSRISVIVRDSDGNRLQGINVSLSSNSSTASISNVRRTTNSNGEALFDVSNTVEESVQFTARATGNEINQTVSVTYTSVSASESSVSANREKVIANGTAVSRITVIARDADGDRLEGVRISLSANSNNAQINNVRRDTDSNGEAIFEVSNSTVESVRFNASGLGTTINQTASVRFVGLDPDESSMLANREKVIANGTAVSRITVTARDEDGDLLEGVRISLNANSNNAQVTNVRRDTDSNGEAVFEVSNSVIESVRFTASGLGTTINITSTVRFVGVDPGESTMLTNRDKVLANGSASGRVFVIARDEDGDLLEGVRVSLNANSNNAEITDVNRDTNSNGEAVFEVRNSVAETVRFSATSMGQTISQQQDIRFVTVDPDQSSAQADPKTVQANGSEESRITVIVRDEDGDLLEGAEIRLQAVSGSSEIENSDMTSDQDGEAEFRVSNTTPEIVEYRIIAEGIEFPERVTVGFVPVAPVVLSANQVKTRSFQANWEMVPGAERYLIDVSTDSSFSSFISIYNSFDTGKVTSLTIDNGIEPGKRYLYRVRATISDLIGANSQPSQVFTFPETPQALSASNRNALVFTAKWTEAEGAENYRLDVSRDPNFESFVDGYRDLDVGKVTSSTISGLNQGQSYFYRVRSEAGPRISPNSNTIETSTLRISSEQSGLESSQLRVLANGEQANEIKVVVRSDEGQLLEGLNVELQAESGNTDIEVVRGTTDEEGVAFFKVTSESVGTVNFRAVTAGVDVGEVEVEFLSATGTLVLGDNYPNPFNRQTTIPLTVPRSMHVNLTIYNSLGAPVRTLIDENMEVGYFEIPFQSNELASGVYFYRVIADGEILTEKMVLVR